MDDQLTEYESQLADIEEVLQASPEDESLLALKRDLVELISLTKAGSTATATVISDPELYVETSDQAETQRDEDDDDEPTKVVTTADVSSAGVEVEAAAAAAEPVQQASNKKIQNIKDFEVPAHLVPLETDTEADKNKKRRAIKTLKSKWREKKKEFESSKKQQTWQNFQQKKKRKDKSIFATQDGDNAKTGVISGGSMTEFGAKKRYKHSA
jgi:survival-of-motor-neuron-related-splicing factor 30